MQTAPAHTISSYGGLYQSRSQIFYPESIADIQQVYRQACTTGQKVGFRGRGYSFDTQGLDNGILISLEKFSNIAVDTAQRSVTVGAGAIWGDILAATTRFGLVPAVMVSTSYASAGGTLAAGCMSRFSTTAGKEGKWVKQFTIVTPDGEVRHCSRSAHTDLFYAAIGGFGYFGAITEIEYQLLYVGLPVHVRTHVILKPDTDCLYVDLLPPPDMGPEQTVYSAFAIAGDKVKVMYCHTAYSNQKKLVPMMPHRPLLNARLLTELMVQWVPPFGQLFWNYAYHVYVRRNNTFIDSAYGYTFFQDGNVRAKRVGKYMGMRFRAIQQTFIIPLSKQLLSTFIDACVQGMKDAGAPPAMIDALCLPEDEGFLLSSTKGMSGYALSIAFESLNNEKIDRITNCLHRLSALCLQMGGRVHLTKNVLAHPADIRVMYADVLDGFFAVKQKYDPQGIIGNEFIERLFVV